MGLDGWSKAFFIILIFGVANVFMKLIAGFDVHPLVFITQSMFFASIFMINIAGAGRFVIETIKSIHSWTFSFSFLIGLAAFMAVMEYMPATQAALFTRSSVIVSAIMAVLFFGRPMFTRGSLGMVVVGFGIYILIQDLDPAIKSIVLILVGIDALTYAIRTFSAEVHKANNKAQTLKQDIRISGFVMAITSVIFTIAIIFFMLFDQHVVSVPFAPSVHDLLRVDSLLRAVFYGTAFVGIERYLEFTTVREIKSEYYLALISLVPVVTYVFEWLFAQFGWLPAPTMSENVLHATAAIVCGSMLAILFSSKPDPEIEKLIGDDYDNVDKILKKVKEETDQESKALQKGNEDVDRSKAAKHLQEHIDYRVRSKQQEIEPKGLKVQDEEKIKQADWEEKMSRERNKDDEGKEE